MSSEFRELIDTLIKMLPDYIDQEHPKGTPERGLAMVEIASFLFWVRKQLK